MQPLGPECLFRLAFDVTGAGEMATNHSRREVIRLYREILVTARHITWADDKGLSWCVQPARASNSLKLLSGHRPHALDENMRCGPSLYTPSVGLLSDRRNVMPSPIDILSIHACEALTKSLLAACDCCDQHLFR